MPNKSVPDGAVIFLSRNRGRCPSARLRRGSVHRKNQQEAGRRKWREREAEGGGALTSWGGEVRGWGCRGKEKIEESKKKKKKKDGSLSHIACVAGSVISACQTCVIHIKLSKLKRHLTPPPLLPPSNPLSISPLSLLPLSLKRAFTHIRARSHYCTYIHTHPLTSSSSAFFFFFSEGNLLRGLDS